ncbi:unnamed protein product [Owenia fusiformis]|uniref:Uncharacterized protein n=1 Tax=Owenia fusiformis TaxID=6347 RepID=A0A8J1UMF4_OWEFU|nr:unnamed protein product [Owenia fusiformis]
MQVYRRSLQQFARILLQNRRLNQRVTTTVVGTNHIRLCSSQTLSLPHEEGSDKQYSNKITNIVEEISQLTLIEVADLNELLKRKLKIADAPVMAMGAAPVAQVAAEEEPEEDTGPKKPLAFTVKLMKFDEKKKVALIKQLKVLMEGMNLVQAKKFVESAPVTVKADIPKEEAEKLKEEIEKAGGSIDIESS